MEESDCRELSQLILEFYEKMSSWENTVVKGSGLSPAQMHTIEMIGHHQALTMKDLAMKMGVTTGTLTVMIDRLEKQDLVKRHRNENDRRSYVIKLTPAGDEHFQEHEKMHNRLTQDLTSVLDEDEIEKVKSVIGRMLEQF